MSNPNELEKTFSEFDTNNTTKSEATDNLLYPDHEDYEYRRIRNTVICHGKLSKEDASAILLQKTYRMFRIHRYFANYYRQFQHVKKVTMRPYFIAFVLNSHASNCDRRKLYETQFSRALFCKKLFKGYTHPPFEVFTVTDQCLLPPYIDCSVLSQFVKKIYHSLILRAFLEWRIIARKQIVNRKLRAQKDIDIIKRQTFGNEYVCFNLWYRYTKRKIKKKMNAKARIPQWDYYMNLIDKKNAKYQKSLDIRLTTIKKAAIQALLNRVISRREEENVLMEADKFRVKRNMIFALSAWAHYIVIQHNRVNMLRAILREWFCLIQQRIHFRDLLKKFQPRHSYYSKRAVFSMFIKNRQISQITSTYLYCKLQTKPSLALYFLAVLTHDDDAAPFYLAMHAWISSYRRRKKWQHFIFQDIKSSNYDTARRKALSVLRKQETALSLFHSNFTSPHFHQETLYMYEYVMKMKTEYETIFLLSSDEEAKEAVANSDSAVEQRELFFKMWLGMKAEPSLIMRLAVINMERRRAEKVNENMRQAERTLTAYQKAVTFLESYNLASEEKFKILKETIVENNKKALANRTRCLHRDKMIIYAHYSHFDAEALTIVKPLFKTNDKLRIVAKIVEATNQLTESFQSLVNIASLGRSISEPNTFSFSHLTGCRSPIKPFNIDHKTLQTKFITKIKKGQISPITQIQFERLMASSSNDTAYKNLKTYQRVDPYSNPLIESKPPPITGVNRRLLQAFPLKGRKPIQIGQKAKKRLNFNVINAQKDSVVEEEEDDFDGFDDIGLGNIRRPGIVNAYDKSKGSMFFNSLKSFANIISQSSFSIFGSSESTVGMDISSIQVPIEEIGDVDLSASESESGRSGRLNTPENSEQNRKQNHQSDDGDEINETNDSPLIESSPLAKEEKKQEKKTVAFRGLHDGFDEELMKSINKSNPPKSPEASQKTKLFIEILFGRANRNLISVPIMNLKKRLIQELKNQKEGAPIPGIMTQETVMPIANLLDLYHEDREKQLKGSSSSLTNENSADNENNNSSRTARNDLYSVNYQSKKYRSLKKKHRFQSDTDSSDDESTKQKQNQNEEENKNKFNKESLQKLDLKNHDESLNSKDSNDDENTDLISDNNDDKTEYEYEYDENGEVDENGKKKRIKRKKKKGNKGSSRTKNSKEKESSRSKKDKSKNSDEKNKKGSLSSRNKESGDEKSSSKKRSKTHKDSETKSGRSKKKKGGKRNESNEYETESESSTRHKKNRKKTSNNNGEYDSASYSETENGHHEKNSLSEVTDSSRDRLDHLFDNDDDYEEDEEGKNEVENEIDNNEIDDFDDEKADDEDGESSRTKNAESYEISDIKSIGTTSSQNSRLSTASSIKSHASNPFTPFMTIEEKNLSGQNPLANVDKIFYSYLQKNLEEEEQLDLVDLDGDDELARNRREMLMNKNVQNRRRLWKPPKFTNSLNPHHRNPLIKLGKSPFNKGPIVIKEERMITQSMRQTLHEENILTRIVYNNGKTLIKPAKRTTTSQSKPLSNSFSKFSHSTSLSASDLYITKLGDNIKLDKSKFETKLNNFDEDQVVTFGGGGRGISEEALNLQRIRDLRNKHLLNRKEAKLREEYEFKSSSIYVHEYDFLHRKKSKKAKEYEDLSSDFSNLRSIVTQLIQMMASSRDDSKEFEILRKRARFLRKKPSFVGLVVPDKLTPDQFCKKMQNIFMKYMRKKNAQATANELFQVMKNNLEFAPTILRIIEKTANEERRYIDSKLQRSRLGKQPAEQGNVVHYIDLDWMSAIPDYKSVALQYKFGFDHPENLEAIVAPTKEDAKNARLNRSVNGNIKRKRNDFIFADPSKTNWDRTLEKYELQDLVMISNWVPEELMDEVIEDHLKNRRKVIPTPENNS